MTYGEHDRMLDLAWDRLRDTPEYVQSIVAAIDRYTVVEAAKAAKQAGTMSLTEFELILRTVMRTCGYPETKRAD